MAPVAIPRRRAPTLAGRPLIRPRALAGTAAGTRLWTEFALSTLLRSRAGLTSGLTPRPDQPLYGNNAESCLKLLPPTPLQHGHLSPAARRMAGMPFVEELIQSLEDRIRELSGEIASL